MSAPIPELKPCPNCGTYHDAKDERIATLEQQLEQWTKWGIIEIAVRNPQVAEYMKHWEERAEKAERQLALKPVPPDLPTDIADWEREDVEICYHNVATRNAELQQQLAQLQKQLDADRGLIEQYLDTLKSLREQVAEARKPVTDEEWVKWPYAKGTKLAYRSDVDALIAARAARVAGGKR